MLEFVAKYGGNVNSQFGEDGIIAECLRRLEIETGHSAECGSNDGAWLSNSKALIDNGWSGTFIEAEWPLYLKCQANWAHRKDVKCICSKVDGHNINAFVKDDCTLLSLDTDGGDYEIFKGLKAKPKIVVIEINSSILPNMDGFSADGGASYQEMVKLALSKGYFLVCHTGNLILVDAKYRELFPEITGDPLVDTDLYFNRMHLVEATA